MENYIKTQSNNTSNVTLQYMVTSLQQNVPNIYLEQLNNNLYILVNKNNGKQYILHLDGDGENCLSFVKTSFSKKLNHYVGEYTTDYIPTMSHLMGCLLEHSIILGNQNPDWD